MTTWTRAAICALSLLLSACAADQTATIGPVAAPRATGIAKAGDRDHAALVSSFGGEARAPALKAIVDEVAGRLVAHSERPGESFEVTFLDSPKVNAFALPSGRLYLTRGLLALANDTSEVAAVVAHEMAHVTRRHASSRREHEARSALISRVASDVLRDPGAGAQIRDQSRAALASFSRAQEFEADALGIATLASAGYDPYAASRFLKALGRQADLDSPDPDHGRPGAPTGSSHPETTARIAAAMAAARRIAASGTGRVERERWLSALDGLAYGDKPADGLARGNLFIHPGLAVAFEAPAGMVLENTPRAVLGTSRDGHLRLLFDAVDVPEGQDLQEFLASTWRDGIEPGSTRTILSGASPVAVASSRGKEWTFRLAVTRIGSNTFRLIVAARGRSVPDLDRLADATLATLRGVEPDEAAGLPPAAHRRRDGRPRGQGRKPGRPHVGYRRAGALSRAERIGSRRPAADGRALQDRRQVSAAESPIALRQACGGRLARHRRPARRELAGRLPRDDERRLPRRARRGRASGRLARPLRGESVDPDQITILAEDGSGELAGFCCILSGCDPVWGSLIDNPPRPAGAGATTGRTTRSLARGRGAGWTRATRTSRSTSPCSRRMSRRALRTSVGPAASSRHWRSSKPDGQRLPIRRYAWDTPADLMAKLGS